MAALSVTIALTVAAMLATWPERPQNGRGMFVDPPTATAGVAPEATGRAAGETRREAALGIFVGSGPDALKRMNAFGVWLGRKVTVGHTYLPGEHWSGIEGPHGLLRPWAKWRRADRRRTLVINVPMVAPNEAGMPDRDVVTYLRRGASGTYDGHFRELARRLVGERVPDTILVLGWEMNGSVYSGRCAPDPAAWKAYWRRIVKTMRSVKGSRFRFDFTFARGKDAIPWTRCYPGDDVVDIIGTDSYDQPGGAPFKYHVREPYGLQDHADFARLHGKPMSFPEWGLFRNSDNPDYIRAMHRWITSHDVAYQTISDYCPHGIWQCIAHPRSAVAYREVFGPDRR
jgi:hypothetical protein